MSSFEVSGQVFLGLAQDFRNGGAIGRIQPRVAPAGLRPRQDLPQSRIDRFLGRGRKGVERFRVDHVTARIFQKSCLQVQRVQRPPLAVARTLSRELLHELVPGATLIGALLNPTGAGAPRLTRDLLAAANSLGLRVEIVKAGSDREFEPAFAEFLRLRVGALLIAGDPLFNGRSEQIAELTVRHKIPSIYQFREFAAAGGLMSYGGSITDAYRQAGVYTGRILSGDKPADLPVQQSTKVELFINLKTAKALGITIPLPLLGRADEVIE